MGTKEQATKLVAALIECHYTGDTCIEIAEHVMWDETNKALIKEHYPKFYDILDRLSTAADELCSFCKEEGTKLGITDPMDEFDD
jgi:hypothetical protein